MRSQPSRSKSSDTAPGDAPAYATLRWEVDGGETRALSLNGGRALAGKGSVVLREEGPVTIRVEGSTVPGRFDLSQNYPNPFNPVTRISYELPVDVHVKLVLYDLLGREVRVLADGVETAGSRTVELDASAQRRAEHRRAQKMPLVAHGTGQPATIHVVT